PATSNSTYSSPARPTGNRTKRVKETASKSAAPTGLLRRIVFPLFVRDSSSASIPTCWIRVCGRSPGYHLFEGTIHIKFLGQSLFVEISHELIRDGDTEDFHRFSFVPVVTIKDLIFEVEFIRSLS